MTDDTPRTGTDGSDDRTTGATTPLASRRDVLQTTAAGTAATGLGAGAVGTASASDHGINTPWLHVEGNKVYDPQGNEVVLRGLNIPDPKRLDHTVPMRGKNWDHMIDLATNEERGWYANVIRIPVHPGDIAELPPVPEADVDVHMPPTFTQDELLDYCENYLDDVVQYCWEQNVYCIVDYHRHWGEGELEWHEDDLDEEVRMFWETVAPRYADDPHVIFEVYNEPTNPAMYVDDWYNAKYAGIWRRWKQTAQPWVDIIREHAPDNLIVIGSPGWSAMPEGAQIEEFDGENLMYAYHIYGGHGLESDEGFDSRQTEEGTNSVWEDVPLFMTEFGWEPNTGQWISGTTDGFGSAVTEWALERPIHWTAWCFDITWLPSMWERSFVDGDPSDSVGDPYSEEIPEHCSDPPCEWDLLGRDVGSYDEYAGEYIRETLEEYGRQDVPQVDHVESPAAPDGVDVGAVDERSADLSWSAASAGGDAAVDHYRVTVDGEPWFETSSTSAEVDDLLAGRTHEVGVRAVDEYGNVGDAATVQVTTDDLAVDGSPSPPADMTLADRTYRSATLSWADGAASGSADVARYAVYVEGSEVARLRADETTYQLEDLELGGEYQVAVSTVDRAGQESEPLSAAVRPRPAHASDDDVLVNDYEGSDPLSENSLGGWVGGGLAEGVEDGVLQIEWDGITYHGTTVDVDATDTPNLAVRARGDAGYELSMLALKAGDAEDGEPVGDITDDRIGTDWSVVEIDLEAAGADLSSPGQLQFDSPWGTAGSFEIDEIWLTGEDDPADGIDLGSQPEPEPPRSPDDQWTNEVTATSIELEWESVLRADHYNVYFEDEVETTTDTSITFTDLEPDTTYEVELSAENDVGESDRVSTEVTTEPRDGGGACEGLPTETVDGQQVCDVNEDGYYRDVTGDGDLAQDDVVAFFENQHRSAWKRDEFDFSGNGEVNQFDVVELFDYVLTQG